MKRPFLLVVLDGFGLGPQGPGNAVELARTPHFDRLWANAPRTTLQASGTAVGLPEGQIGNSEVGHMNLGAGRVVMQSLTYIDSQVASGEFHDNAVLNDVMDRSAGNALHLIGLVSRGGVHSDLEHLIALVDVASDRFGGPVYIHAFTDGRDTPPHSGLGYIGELEEHIASEAPHVRIASVIGRYYAMDRDRRWERTKRAYDLMVEGSAPHRAGDARAAIRAAYDRGETDEFIEPTVVTDGAGDPIGTIGDGDGVIFFNFRADRARQLTYALLGDAGWNEFERSRRPAIHFASLMQYDAALPEELAPFAFGLPPLEPSLAQVLAGHGLTQYHTAETEKYAHVTYFFNAKREKPFPGEVHRLIPSPKVPTYDQQPEMSAPELTRATLERIGEGKDDFILVNYANPDMVGHTGVLAAAIRACEASDEGMGALVEAVLERGGIAMVVADHGNAEQMLEPDGSPHTAHTTNPVPCIIVGAGDLKLREGGVLGDVAPTILELMGVEVPAQMTGRSLLATAQNAESETASARAREQ